MLVSEVKAHLEQVIIPFWKNLKDEEYGGYYGYMDYNLNLDKQATKGCILNSRIMWFFSNAYEVLKEPSLLEQAKHAYHFMKVHCLDQEEGGVYWLLDYKGSPIETMKHTYNQAFAIYALSSYYKATRDKEALRIALDLFKLIETNCKDEYGYLEAFDRHWHPIDNHKLSDDKNLLAEGKLAEKTMNTILHVLEAYTELYMVSNNLEVEKCLIDLLDMVEHKVYNPEKKQLEVFFDSKLQTIADMHSYGHDIEAAWLIDRAAMVLGNQERLKRTRDYTAQIAYKIKEVAMSKGGLNNERFNTYVDTTRIWWVQAEGVVGFINAYQSTKDEAFLDLASQLWEYIKHNMLDLRQGSEWFWRVDETGKPDEMAPIVEPWKCPYHNGRMCLEVIRRGIDV